MDNKKVFRVAVVANLDEREWRVLTTAANLTTARARSYIFEQPSKTAPDIYMVDADSPETLQTWFSMYAKSSLPVVYLKSNPNPAPEKREFSRLIVPSCLLKLVNLLDHISVQELGYVPELTIGQEGSTADTSLAVTVTSSASNQLRFSALVVDDSSTVRAQVGLGLKIFGASADFAESAEDAYELLARNTYDIAFLDVILPGVDGYQICKTIKKNPKHRQTAVIMLTSKSSTIDRVKASLAGCDAFLTKPVQNEQFQEILGKYLVDSIIDDIEAEAAHS